MGYYATGGGSICFNSRFDDAAKKTLEDYLKESSPAPEYGFDSYDEKYQLWMSVYDKYYEDEWKDFFKAIDGHVESGEVNFTGEEGDIWRFRYDPDTESWLEERGSIWYPEGEDIPLIKAALAEYAVTHPEKKPAIDALTSYRLE